MDSMGVGGGGGSEQGGSMGGSTAVQPGAKRQRRTSTRGKAAPGNAAAAAGDAAAQTGSGSSAGAAMLPPSRKAAGAAGGRAAAAAGAQPAAGSGVYGTRRSYAVPTDVAFEPSQQVGVVIRNILMLVFSLRQAKCAWALHGVTEVMYPCCLDHYHKGVQWHPATGMHC